MKIEIDTRRKDQFRAEPYFAIRLFPETNEEMAAIEWGMSIGMQPSEIIRVSNDSFHYCIPFVEKEK